jgi:hypothetical protein
MISTVSSKISLPWNPLLQLGSLSATMPQRLLLTFCALMILFRNLFLRIRISSTKKHDVKRLLVVGIAEDPRDHLLVYLFAAQPHLQSASVETDLRVSKTLSVAPPR